MIKVRIRQLNWPVLTSLFFIMALSLVTLASFSLRDDPPLEDFYRQAIWFAIGMLALIFFVVFDYRIFLNYSWAVMVVYGLGLFLLLLTFAMPAIRGSQSWLVLGPLRFQPVELAKLALLLVWAKFFSRRHVEIARSSIWATSFIYAIPILAIVASQPDLGSALILFSLWLIMILVSGVRAKHFFLILLLCIVAATIMWVGVLHDYQKERITSFLVPNYDPLGAGYNVNQSKIAIGSGGIFGKGLGKGTQVQYEFLPEAKTDFIFAGFIEEWGLVGAAVLLGIFFYMMWHIILVGVRADNNFARLFCFGVVGLFAVQFLLNAGSNVGIVPVTGVTFPFFSYGGSSILINMSLIGLVQSIYARSVRRYETLEWFGE